MTASQPLPTMREEFEAYSRSMPDGGFTLRRYPDDSKYVHYNTEEAWKAWQAAIAKDRARAAPLPVTKLPRHKFWAAGELECPQELKAPNGELHTMRCKVCGDGWRDSSNVCLAALQRAAAVSPVAPPPITLFDAIKHGDAEHQAWLKAAIDAHFAGLPVPPYVAAAPSPVAPPPITRRIVCAAIRAENGDVMVGIRHYSQDMHYQIQSRPDGRRFENRFDDDQGFVNTWGEYFTRQEAYVIAQANGQIIRPEACPDNTLYSEGLY